MTTHFGSTYVWKPQNARTFPKKVIKSIFNLHANLIKKIWKVLSPNFTLKPWKNNFETKLTCSIPPPPPQHKPPPPPPPHTHTHTQTRKKLILTLYVNATFLHKKKEKNGNKKKLDDQFTNSRTRIFQNI